MNIHNPNHNAHSPMLHQLQSPRQPKSTTSILSQQQPDINISNNLYRVKIDYLLDQKQRLEIEVADLYKNNQLLRDINKEIVKQQQQQQQQQQKQRQKQRQSQMQKNNISQKQQNTENKKQQIPLAKQSNPIIKNILEITSVIDRNYQLESRIKMLNKQNKKLKDKIFLSDQVEQSNQKDYKQIFTRYQDKIIDLRKLIQVKQGHIQVLQQSISNGNSGGSSSEPDWTLPRIFRIQLFNKNQQLKIQIMQLQRKNEVLMNQNIQINKQNIGLKEKMQKIQRLVSRNCSYIEFKNIMMDRTVKSVHKNGVHIQLKNVGKLAQNQYKKQCERQKQRQKQRQRSSQQVNAQTANQQRYKNTSTTLEIRNRLLSVSDALEQDQTLIYKILKNKMKKIKYLEDKLKKSQSMNQQKQKQIDKLIQSNKIYEKSRRSITQSCHLFESICRILYDNLTRRKCNELYVSNRSHDDNQLIKNGFLQSFKQNKKLSNIIKTQQKLPIIFIDKQKWTSIQQLLNNRRPALIQKQNNYLRRRRSQSCILDYFITIIDKQQQLNEKVQNFQEKEIELDLSQNFNKNFNGFDMKIERKKKNSKVNICLGGQDDFLNALDDF